MQRKWYKAQALGCPLWMLIATEHRTKISRAIHGQIVRELLPYSARRAVADRLVLS